MRPTSWRVVWLTAAFLGIALLAFGPALRAPFDFDDLPAIVHNFSIRQLWPLSVPLTPPGLGTAASGRPIANLSFALSYAINGWLGIAQSPATPAPDESIGYHIAGVLLHVATALLLFAVVRLTIRRGRIADGWREAADRIAFVASAIWLAHPIQTEAVDYVSQRTELLVSFFYMTTLYCGIRASDASSAGTGQRQRLGARWWYIVAVVACLLGMGSKEVMLTAPIAITLYDRAFLFESWRAVWASQARRRFYMALVATSGLSIFLIATGGRAETVGFQAGTSWFEYLYSQGWAIGHYLRLMLWPNQLTYDYGQNPVRDLSGIPGVIALSALAVATLLAWRRPQHRWLAFLGTWFFLLLAPSSSVVPIRTEIAAERRVYLAFAAVAVLAAVGLEQARRRFIETSRFAKRHDPRRRRAVSYVIGTLLYSAMIAATFERSRLYQTPELLWRDAALKRPNNARAWNGVAVAEMRRDPADLAEPDSLLARALAVDSTFGQAWLNRAVIAVHGGRLADAERLLRRALQIEPGDSAATEQLGAVLVARGQSQNAVTYLAQVARVFPNAKSLTELGAAYLTAGLLDSAVVTLRRATELDSTRVDALNYLGAALVESGRGAEAVRYLRRSVERDSGTGFSLGLLCVAYGEVRQGDLAAQTAAAAVARAPNNPEIYLFAGRGMQAAGRFMDAVNYLEQAVRLNPSDPQALTRLGIADASLGKIAAARQYLQRALAIAPDYYPAVHAVDVLARPRP